MQHGLDFAVVATLAGCVVLWSLVSTRFERWNITAPMAFVAVGLLTANGPTGFLHVGIGSTALGELAEIALAVVLFGDAAQVNVRTLRGDAGLPGRLLGVGLPLTMAMGTVGAKLLFPDLSWWVCAVIGASVAPTDAALGVAIIEDERVPSRIRRVLNVESGLNDGIVTPFVNVFIVGAVLGTALETESEGGALLGLLIGIVGGILVGAIGGRAMAWSKAKGLGGTTHRAVGVASLSILAYALTVELDGNGFVAAFVAGLAYGAVTSDDRAESLEFTHQSAALLSSLVWFMFGAAMVPLLDAVTWQDVVFALTALTVVRMVPVAISLLGAGFDRPTIAVIGWFGPRGLASVVFALLAVEGLLPEDGNRAVVVITATVLASVVLHGISAAPIARRYGVGHHD